MRNVLNVNSMRVQLTPSILFVTIWSECVRMPSIPTLEALCKAFGMSMAQFFSTDNLIAVTPELKEVFDSWITLTSEQKEATRSMMRAFHRDP